MSAVIEAEIVSSPSFLAPIDSGLTTRQNLFVHYYLQYRNGTKAARLAGYSGDDNCLGKQSHDNLSLPKIREAIETYFKSRHLSPNGVLAELSDIASSPWREHVEVKYGENGEVVHAQLKLADKIKALELTGKAQGMFVERTESVNVNIDLNGNDLASILTGALSQAVEPSD